LAAGIVHDGELAVRAEQRLEVEAGQLLPREWPTTPRLEVLPQVRLLVQRQRVALLDGEALAGSRVDFADLPADRRLVDFLPLAAEVLNDHAVVDDVGADGDMNSRRTRVEAAAPIGRNK